MGGVRANPFSKARAGAKVNKKHAISERMVVFMACIPFAVIMHWNRGCAKADSPVRRSDILRRQDFSNPFQGLADY
jgi:hypothetical protein